MTILSVNSKYCRKSLLGLRPPRRLLSPRIRLRRTAGRSTPGKPSAPDRRRHRRRATRSRGEGWGWWRRNVRRGVRGAAGRQGSEWLPAAFFRHLQPHPRPPSSSRNFYYRGSGRTAPTAAPQPRPPGASDARVDLVEGEQGLGAPVATAVLNKAVKLLRLVQNSFYALFKTQNICGSPRGFGPPTSGWPPPFHGSRLPPSSLARGPLSGPQACFLGSPPAAPAGAGAGAGASGAPAGGAERKRRTASAVSAGRCIWKLWPASRTHAVSTCARASPPPSALRQTSTCSMGTTMSWSPQRSKMRTGRLPTCATSWLRPERGNWRRELKMAGKVCGLCWYMRLERSRQRWYA